MTSHATIAERAARLESLDDVSALNMMTLNLGKAPERRRRAPARAHQGDVAGEIRAAKQTGAGGVQTLPGGTIRMDLAVSGQVREKPADPVEEECEVVL